MDADRILYLFREYLWMDEAGTDSLEVEWKLQNCGASIDEIRFLRGEIPNGGYEAGRKAHPVVHL